MPFLDKFPSNPTGDELMLELRKFFKDYANGSSKSLDDAIRSGLWLMKHLPASRDSVLEIISRLYKEFAQRHLSNVENGDGVIVSLENEIDDFLKDIHSTFLLFLESNPEIWSPILSSWTLHLLGLLSSVNSSRPLFTKAQSVNEVINIWMGSKAIQSLLTITSRCLTSENTDSFISALLDTSAAHSPYFDWVVAHVGNTYSQIVVYKVLSLGFNNFSSPTPVPSRLSSVTCILAHLSTTHSKEVQIAFDLMIQTVLTGSDPIAEKFAIPYLLQLCSSSVPLLDVLMETMLPKIKEETLMMLRPLIASWIPLHFGNNDKALIALVIHLILKSNRGPTALQTLMNGCKAWRASISLHARKLMKSFMIEISSLLYESTVSHSELVKNFPCIAAFKDESNSETLIQFLTDEDTQIAQVSKQVVKLISLYESETVAVKALVHYLRFAIYESHLWYFINLLGSLEIKYSALLGSAIKTIVVESRLVPVDPNCPEQLRPWETLARIIKTEQRISIPVRIKFSLAIRDNLKCLIELLDVRKRQFRYEEAMLIVSLLSKVPDITLNKSFGLLLKLERYLVELFFKIISLSDQRDEIKRGSKDSKIQHVANISKLLNEVCGTQGVQNDALRSLVQLCLNPEFKQLFQGKKIGSSSQEDKEDDEFQPERFSMYFSLLQENRKRTASVSMNRTYSTSFHSGKLSKGNDNIISLASRPKFKVLENRNWGLNVNLFLSTLISVCMASSNGGTELVLSSSTNENSSKKRIGAIESEVCIDAMRKVALLLVEIVSPDVMFNGLPWPEEEMAKIQVERDLQIRRAFEDHPYLWDLLELVANYSPSLCYCSVLLRALMSTFMAHWTSCQKALSKLYPTQLKWTIRLINIMKIGQLLPAPLCHIGLLIEELKANEVLYLLRDIWAYMKVNVPVPTLFIIDPYTKKFTRGPDFYNVEGLFSTENLRLAIVNNIEKLGHLYPKLFPYHKLPYPPIKTENTVISSSD